MIQTAMIMKIGPCPCKTNKDTSPPLSFRTKMAGVRVALVFTALGAASPAALGLEAADQAGKVFRFFGLGSNPPAQPAPDGGFVADCPNVFVDPGAGELRAPPGVDSASVRYQISIAEIARECSAQNEQITIKLGVAGAVVLGPLGQPGSYGGSLRISLRRSKDDAIVSSKTYRVGATVPASAARADFRIVPEPIIAPVTALRPADEYEVLIGFAGAGEGDNASGKPRRR